MTPQNLIVSYQGEVKLYDFGIAKATKRVSRTDVGTVKGNFAYMAPEQVQGRPGERWSDMFSLGVIFYEMLTGEQLFVGETDLATLEAIRSGYVPDHRRFSSKLSPRVVEILMGMLAQEPEERYAWASETHEDLLDAMADDGIVFQDRHLRDWMQAGYVTAIEADNAKMEAFMQLHMPHDAAPESVAQVVHDKMVPAAKKVESADDAPSRSAARIAAAQAAAISRARQSRAEETVRAASNLVSSRLGRPGKEQQGRPSAMVRSVSDDEEEVTLQNDASRFFDRELARAADVENLPRSTKMEIVRGTFRSNKLNAALTEGDSVSRALSPALDRDGTPSSTTPVSKHWRSAVESRATAQMPNDDAEPGNRSFAEAASSQLKPSGLVWARYRLILGVLLAALVVLGWVGIWLIETPIRKVSLKVQSHPMVGAKVFVDGEPVGHTPVEVAGLSVGHHLVHVEADGYESYTQTVQLSSAKPHAMTVPLKAAKAVVPLLLRAPNADEAFFPAFSELY